MLEYISKFAICLILQKILSKMNRFFAKMYYKILYVMEFYNKERGEKKYMVLDSLTGDLEKIAIEQ